MKKNSSSIKARAAISALFFVTGIALVLLAVKASDPPTSNVTVPSTVGQTVSVNWTGTIPAGSNATSNCTMLADTPAVDQHVSTINVPAGVYNTVSALFVFKITWTP